MISPTSFQTKKKRTMGSDEAGCFDPSPSSPKLSLFSLPSKAEHRQEAPWMSTPPIRALAAVPFQWEEAPGKPRACTSAGDDDNRSKANNPVARCLELPPRLLNEAKAANLSQSPTTVLDGPYVGRSLSDSSSLGKGRSFNSSENLGRRVMFGSARWGSFRKNIKEMVGNTSLRYSASIVDADAGGCGGDGDPGINGCAVKVKITRIRRRSSFLNPSSTRSHLWTSICEGFKQVVPWRRRQEKLRKTQTTSTDVI